MESYMDKLNMNTVTVHSGVDYATVESRVRAFCSEHQNGQILTEMVKCEDDTGEVVFKAMAVVGQVIKGTGHAMEVRGSSNINKTSHVECAETSAVGRALAMMGYMSKSQIASYEEIENAISASSFFSSFFISALWSLAFSISSYEAI
jgi:hypothetical protein